MGIRFACHVCGHSLNIKQDLAGRVGVCPKCQGRFRIPLQDSPQSIPLNPAEPVAAAERSAARSALEDPEAQWYVRPPAGGQYGPAGSDLIRQWIGENRITPSTLLWRQGWAQWRSAHEALPEGTFAPVAETVEPAVAAPPAAPPPAAGTVDAAPVGEPVILFGKAEVGQVRGARSRRRLMVVIVLGLLSLCLIGLLVALALRS